MNIIPPVTSILTIVLEGDEIDDLGTLAEVYLDHMPMTGATAAMARAILEATEAVT
jgi:hypothetical protein